MTGSLDDDSGDLAACPSVTESAKRLPKPSKLAMTAVAAEFEGCAEPGQLTVR